jgi:FAD/FMN-containing dehydrogenase
MARVLELQPSDGWVLTQPGIMNTALGEHVRGHGLWYAPDPASKDFCSIGGNFNTNAGGLCCVKYGVTATRPAARVSDPSGAPTRTRCRRPPREPRNRSPNRCLPVPHDPGLDTRDHADTARHLLLSQ